MKTLFVEKQSMELRYERACLLLYHEGKRVSSVPLAQIERIVVAPHVALSAGVLGLIAEKEVALPIQFSVFEIDLMPMQMEKLLAELTTLIEASEDKVTFYRLSPHQERISLGQAIATEDLFI